MGISRRKERMRFRRGHHLLEGERKGKCLSCRLLLLSLENRKSPRNRLPYWCLDRKFQTGWLVKITFLGEVETSIRLVLNLVSWQQWSHFGKVVFFLTNHRLNSTSFCPSLSSLYFLQITQTFTILSTNSSLL